MFFSTKPKTNRLITFHGFIVTLLFFCTSNTILWCQSLGKLIDTSLDSDFPLTVRVYGTDDGIPQHQITDIVESSDGTIIISTANGYSKFNGWRFRDINPSNETKKILCQWIHLDKKTGILYGLTSRNIVYEISPTTKKIFPSNFLLTRFERDSLLFIDHNRCYQIVDLNTKKGRKLGIINDTLPIHGIDFIHDKPFYSNKNGTFVLDKSGEWKLFSKTIYTESRKNPYTQEVYLLGSKQILMLKNELRISLLFPDQHTESKFSDIAFTPHGEIYVSSFDGIYYKTEKSSAFKKLHINMTSQKIISLHYFEDEDLLFAGNSDLGLLQIKRKNCISYFDSHNQNASSLSSIIETRSREILTCGTHSTIFEITNDGFKKYPPFSASFSCLGWVNDQLWAGTWGNGIYILEKDQLKDSISTNRFQDQTVISIFQDRKKRIWIGTNDGVSVGENQSTISPLLPNQIKGKIICFYQLRNGNILIGGENGVVLFSENLKILKQIGPKQGLESKEVRAIYEQKDGSILIGTYGGGLYYWSKNNFISVNRLNNCMLNTDIFTLAPDKKGNLYMTSNHGLYVISEQKITDFVSKKVDYLVPFRLGHDDGILNTEFNGGFQNNYFTRDSKYFYFPTLQGVVVSFFEIPKFRKLTPVLSSVLLNDQKNWTTNNVFPKNTHTVSLQVYCPNYAQNYNLYYQYKLVGPNSKATWSTLSKNGEISFKMLPPGEYTVYVRSIDGFNDSEPNQITFSFKIDKSFYETLWFRVLIFWTVLILLIVTLYKRIQYVKNKELKESNYKNTMIELKLKAIQAKMNPHFIFNCLNNIQNLILMEKIEGAEHALSNFSILLRKFLQQSDHSFIPLREEVELLKAYISVEQFRFDGELQVSISIPENILNYKIPTLLIQPAIENSILHGLSHKKGEKKLVIEGKIEEEYIIIKIEDNGIGREAASKLNVYRTNHVSQGWKIVNDKINLLKSKHHYAIKFEIIDKKDANGTIVIFSIPLTDIELLDN